MEWCSWRGRVCATLVSVAVAASASAQEAVSLATVGGRVTDEHGGVLVGAHVVARHLETSLTAEASTDTSGRFRFPYLKLGPYEVTVSQAGFSPITRGLVLTVGSAFELRLTLALETVTANVTVTADRPVLEGARSQIAATVEQSEIRSLPLNGRNFLDIALLVPGVAPPNLASTQIFPETSAVPGPGLSVASQRNLSNNFIVDGLSANDDAAGLSGMPYGVDAIEQFQVVTSGGQAELGRALGGYVNLVTKSGTNWWRGDAYGYFRDDALNAPNPLSRTTLPMSQRQFGASLGGPIAKDRTFFFGNAERRELDQTGLTTISAANAATLNRRLQEVGYPGLPVEGGQYRNPLETVNVLAKVDRQLGGRDLVSVRYSAYRATAQNARGAGGLSAPSASSGLRNGDHALATGYTHTLSSGTVNELRAQYAWSDLRAAPTDGTGPAVTIAGVATFGTLSTSPTRRENTMIEVVDNLSHHRGAHAFRVGVAVLHHDNTITFPRAVRGAYVFSSLASFLAGQYNNLGYTQTFGASEVQQVNPNIGVYAQDEWRVADGLTLNLGIRYDLQFLETIRTDRNNVAPRVGFAWSPGASQRTVVRGSAGLFFDRLPLRALANGLLSAGNTTDLNELRQTNIALTPGQAGAPVFPQVLDRPVPSVTLVNLTTMDRRMQNAYSRQASAEVERQFGDRMVASASYQHVRGQGLIMAINQNVPTCLPSGTNNACRPNPSYANNNQYRGAAESSYHGLQLSLIQRPGRWASYRASYTLSTAQNNVGEFFFSSPIDPFDLSKDWGRSDDDQRHRFVASGAIRTPSGPGETWYARVAHDLELSGVVQYYSALPFNIVSGVTTLQGTAGRPLIGGQFIERNSGIGNTFLNLGLRVSRTLRAGSAQVQLLAEGFNLTSHRNVLTRNTNFGTGVYPDRPLPAFGQITAVAEPRAWQLGARVRF